MWVHVNIYTAHIVKYNEVPVEVQNVIKSQALKKMGWAWPMEIEKKEKKLGP